MTPEQKLVQDMLKRLRLRKMSELYRKAGAEAHIPVNSLDAERHFESFKDSHTHPSYVIRFCERKMLDNSVANFTAAKDSTGKVRDINQQRKPKFT